MHLNRIKIQYNWLDTSNLAHYLASLITLFYRATFRRGLSNSRKRILEDREFTATKSHLSHNLPQKICNFSFCHVWIPARNNILMAKSVVYISLEIQVTPFVTRMHSSRMRTARSLPYRGCLCWGGSRPPRAETPRQRPPWTETPWSCDLWRMLGQRPPCEQNHRQV